MTPETSTPGSGEDVKACEGGPTRSENGVGMDSPRDPKVAETGSQTPKPFGWWAARVSIALGVAGFFIACVNSYFNHFHIRHELKAHVVSVFYSPATELIESDLVLFNSGDRTEVVLGVTLMVVYDDSLFSSVLQQEDDTQILPDDRFAFAPDDRTLAVRDSSVAWSQFILNPMRVEPRSIAPDEAKHIRVSKRIRPNASSLYADASEIQLLVAMRVDVLGRYGNVIDSCFPIAGIGVHKQPDSKTDWTVWINEYPPEVVDLTSDDRSGCDDKPPEVLFRPGHKAQGIE
jgi:hypothetical protein